MSKNGAPGDVTLVTQERRGPGKGFINYFTVYCGCGAHGTVNATALLPAQVLIGKFHKLGWRHKGGHKWVCPHCVGDPARKEEGEVTKELNGLKLSDPPGEPITGFLRVDPNGAGRGKSLGSNASLSMARITDQQLKLLGLKVGDRLSGVLVGSRLVITEAIQGRPSYKISRPHNGITATCRIMSGPEMTRQFGLDGRQPTKVEWLRATYFGRPALVTSWPEAVRRLQKARTSNRALCQDPGTKYRTVVREREPLYNPDDNPSGEVRELKNGSPENHTRNTARVLATLYEVFNQQEGRYDPGHSDDTVAKSLDLSPAFVRECREAVDMHIVEDRETAELREQLSRVERDLSAIREILAPIVTSFYKVKAQIEGRDPLSDEGSGRAPGSYFSRDDEQTRGGRSG